MLALQNISGKHSKFYWLYFDNIVEDQYVVFYWMKWYAIFLPQELLLSLEQLVKDTE